MKAWYEEWFNSDEYLSVYQHRDSAEADDFAKLICALIEVPLNCETLDLACGAGRHSIAFARQGHKVTGVDLSPLLIKTARQQAAAENIAVDFLERNIIGLNLERKFNLVLNIFTSFGYFSEDADNFRIFETAANHLQDSGIFVFDYFNSAVLEKSLVPYSRKILGLKIIEQIRSITNGFVSKKILIQSGSTIKMFSETVKLYPVKILVYQLESAGFTIQQLLAGYEGNPFDEETSPRFIAICRKS